MKRLNTPAKAAVLSIIALFLHAPSVYAICPVCTIAVGAGLGLSRWLGIDDSVSGIWIGGFLLSSSLWFNNWLSKKNFFENKFRLPLVLVSMYALVLIPLWTTKVIGHPYNTILGIDKLVFGTIAGTLTFGFGVVADKMVRKIKGGQLFNFQKVVFPVVLLLIVSIVTYFYGGYLY
jgi:hypothetical protein